MPQIHEFRAPRFRAYMNGTRGALFMLRSDWQQLLRSEHGPFEIELTETPFAAMPTYTAIVGSFAERVEGNVGLITIFRDDPVDAPNFINTDKYEVWEDVRTKIDIQQVVAHSSTNDDSAMQSFLEDYVTIIPAAKGTDHHLPALPRIYQATLEERRDTS
jgi:hypothetical protein